MNFNTTTRRSDIFGSIREAQRKLEEISSRIDPLFRGLKYPIQIIEFPHMSEHVQVRFPRSKKKRIRRKWAKDQLNYSDVPQNKVYAVNGSLVMHPDLARKIRDAMEKKAITSIEQNAFWNES